MEWHEYKSHINNALDNFEFDEEIPKLLKESIDKDQKIFVAGNGGSAALASHYVCDLSKGATNDWSKNFKRYKAICLSSNIGYMTAISNDAHYQDVFKQQLINLASPGDIVILISSSGNSPNVVEAAKWAKENGLKVIGVTGFKGGRLKELSDHSAHMACESYEVCEDIHAVFGHFLAAHLRERLD
ncbi:SIS domain-containing protein [Nanoarchaeota archaeon]